MVYWARSVYLVGFGVLAIGILWAVAIWKNVTALMPDFFDQPFTALALCAVGLVVTSLGKSAGGSVFGDDIDDDIPSFDISRFLPAKAEKSKGGKGAKRMDDYRDMLDNEGAEFHQPGAPVSAPAPKGGWEHSTDPAVRQELIGQLLQGGAKAAERFTPSGGGAVPEAPPAPVDAAPFAGGDAMPRGDMACGDEGLAPPPAPVSTDVHGLRMRLQVALPQHPTESWIGGGPSLPADMPWPQIGGTPASFYAQIALADLPPALWGGRGPREGWLIFFGADDPSEEVVVLHSLERGEMRAPPEGADHYFKFGSGEEKLADLIGPEALQPPRWFLEASCETAGPRRPQGAGDPFAALLEKPSMTDPGFLPFDWPTGFALLDAVEAMMLRLIGRARKLAAKDDAGALAQLEPLGEMLARVRVVMRKTEARAEAVAFDEQECARLIGMLARMTNEGWMSEEARAQGRKPASLLQFQGFAGYRKIYEAQARRSYAADPESLPQATRDRLLPVWQEMAAGEALYLGSTHEDRLPTRAPCLLILPSSDLAGWQIGEMSTWAVQISPDALQSGNFTAASAENSQGKHWGG